MKLKEKYKKFRMDGVFYDFSNYNEERLRRIWENQPHLRFMFEEDIEIPEELIDLGIETPEEFEEVVKDIVKPKRKRK